jgi:hypothetical protein
MYQEVQRELKVRQEKRSAQGLALTQVAASNDAKTCELLFGNTGKEPPIFSEPIQVTGGGWIQLDMSQTVIAPAIMHVQNHINMLVLTLMLQYVLFGSELNGFRRHMQDIVTNAGKGLIVANFKRLREMINAYGCDCGMGKGNIV